MTYISNDHSFIYRRKIYFHKKIEPILSEGTSILALSPSDHKICALLLRYNAVLDCKTGVVFYVDTFYETCSLTPPREATLSWAFEHSTPTTRVLGQRREWEVGPKSTPGFVHFTSHREFPRISKFKIEPSSHRRSICWVHRVFRCESTKMGTSYIVRRECRG